MDFTERYEDTWSAVALAVRAGGSRQVHRLIQQGFAVDVRDNRGWNPLHEAAAAGSADYVRRLLSAAVDCEDYVNTPTHNSETPLYFAAMNGHHRAAKCLIKSGADLNKTTNDLSCPLFAAVDGGHREVVELLVIRGADVTRTHPLSGWSCLHHAAYKGHAEIVKYLVGVCNLEAVDDFRITPLFVAAQYGHHQCIEILANAGANVNCWSKDLTTPLFTASQEGHLSCLESLLSLGADPNLYCNEARWQLPIHIAIEYDRLRILKKLIPVTNQDRVRGEGRVNPIYLAVLLKRVDCLRALLKDGYSTDTQTYLDYTSPLEMAFSCYSSSSNIKHVRENIEILLNAGAPVVMEIYTHALGRATYLPPNLPMVLEYIGLPRRDRLGELAQIALTKMSNVSYWLPLLLKAGMDPMLLLQDKMLEAAESRVLNFFMEFINWKTLPNSMLRITSYRRSTGRWKPRKHFDSLPPLTHLCRLAVRASVGSLALAKTSFVQQLPIPTLLQDYLQFSDVSPL